METINITIDTQQFLLDLVQAIREYAAKAPDAGDDTHLCLSCWRHISSDYCTFCCTADYSVPALAIDQIASLQRTLDRLESGKDPFSGDEITEDSL